MIHAINTLYTILEKNNFIKSVVEIKPYTDEPCMYFYSVELENDTNSDIKTWNGLSSGFSFFSRKMALLKSLSEAGERLSNSSFQKKDFLYAKFHDLPKNTALSPKKFTNDKQKMDGIFGWKEGWNFFTDKKILLPAQTLFFTYPLTTEPQLTEMISTGAAAGFDKNSATLRAILEVIERDAFMTMWLTQIPPIRVDIKSIIDKSIQTVMSKINKYNLDIYLFDITHDLKVPCFMTILVDATGQGPAVSVGLKAGFDYIEGIIGSIQESLHSRNWIKNEILKRKYIHKKISDKKISTLLQRGLYWAPLSNISSLSFLFNQKPIKRVYKNNPLNEKNCLKTLRHILKTRKKSVYIADITHPIFKNSSYLVFKAIIPDLQPLYLSERKKHINNQRLKEYAIYKGKNIYAINTQPHPFL